MEVSLQQLSRVQVLASLQESELRLLQSHATLQAYPKSSLIIEEGDHLTASLYAVVSGSIRISKTASTGKETILRTLTAGEIFAAPALFGNSIAPATVSAEEDCQILKITRQALLQAIQISPEIALNMLSVFNERLQQMHNTIHGLISERAIVRLVRYLQYFADLQGIESTADGDRLKVHLSHYQIARSIGITYEECVRLFKQIQLIVTYSRGGVITVHDWKQLEAIDADH